MPVSANTNFYEGNVDIKSKYLATSDAQFVDLTYFTEQGLNDIGKGLWSWGGSSFYGTGFDDRGTRSTPTQIGTLSNWKLIDSENGNYEMAAAVKTDGTLWTWGRNEEGQLGLGNRTHRSSPVQVGSLTDWLKVSVGGRHCVALKTDGTIWSWGENSSGELGLGNTTNVSSPVQIGLSTDWYDITAGDNQSYAIKTNRTLWGFGNIFFATGGSSTSSPVQIGSATWNSVSSSVAGGFSNLGIQTDNTLWVWGVNSFGQLGMNDITDRSVITQNPYISSVKSIYIGAQASFAITTSNQLRAWGRNDQGQLGLNDITHRSFPSQVGSLTNWKNVSSDGSGTIATKIDGTLWAWGSLSNINGGAAPTRVSSPVQIGSLTGWVNVSGGNSAAFAIKL